MTREDYFRQNFLRIPYNLLKDNTSVVLSLLTERCQVPIHALNQPCNIIDSEQNKSSTITTTKSNLLNEKTIQNKKPFYDPLLD